MNKKKIKQQEQQHTVPGSYLENFADENGHVWVLDTDDKIFNVSPSNILKERHFYSLSGSDGEKDMSVEDTLASIEGDFINIYREKFAKDLFLADEERIAVSVFIAALMTRTRPHRDHLKKSLEEIQDWMEDWNKHPMSDEEKRTMEAIPSSGGATIDLKTLKSGLKNFDEHHSTSILRSLSHSAALIYHMKWSVWKNENYGFVTSDDPVVLLRPASIKKFGTGTFGSAPGLKWKDVELTLPLSKGRFLLAGWILNNDSYIQVEDEMARKMNHRTITHSRDRIIVSSKTRAEEIKTRYTEKPYKSKIENIVANKS
ncbi:MAG: hypothetical protein A3H58_02005 [Candidatus Taylorbacteria bacterium RIFCSPLOWO2_02_FULL_43_22b]|nr:MAG: hypothetical protein A3H58_02005 [Candidatus Taylorbacteria bacterium RIFCSPLOWO2_02_FULL_43_22b]